MIIRCLLFAAVMLGLPVWPFHGAWPLARAAETPSSGPGGESINVMLQDLELLNEDGRTVRFKTGVVGDRLAVIIPFYTTCTTNYPILIFAFTRLQEMLGEALRKDVVLVSVSVDPRTDIPVCLNAFARRNKAKPGWTFLTGDADNLGKVLSGVGALLSDDLDQHNHMPITIVGSADGEWRRLHGFPSPDQIMALVWELQSARQTAKRED